VDSVDKDNDGDLVVLDEREGGNNCKRREILHKIGKRLVWRNSD
jgi:hypothetical protein